MIRHQRLIAISSLLLLGACFRHVVEERQLSDAAYLKFPRLESGVQLRLTGETEHQFRVEPDSSARYQVRAGTWRLTVSRAGVLLMDRKLFLSPGETREFDLR